jgi:hypothetical protein
MGRHLCSLEEVGAVSAASYPEHVRARPSYHWRFLLRVASLRRPGGNGLLLYQVLVCFRCLVLGEPFYNWRSPLGADGRDPVPAAPDIR